jgi:Xaa-Pro aminopeptidase
MAIMPTTPRAVLEDRWSRLQAMIRKEGVQALILCGRGKIGSYGNIHYVSSYYLYSVSSYAVLMPDGVPTLVLGHRDQEFARELGLGDFVPEFHAADFTSTMFRVAGQSAMGEQLIHVLRSKKVTSGPVGIVGLSGIMPVEDYLHVRQGLPGLELRDVTPAYSAVKAIKSPAEIALIEETYEIADEGFRCFVEQLAVGKTEWEVCGEVEGTVRKRGALQTYIFSESGEQYPRCATARRYAPDDLIACFVEVIGPNGTWVEKGSTFAFPEVPASALTIADSALKALHDVERTLRPGGQVQSAFRAAQAEADAHGYRQGVWAGHGVGVDHDYPILGDDDPSPFARGMVVAVHPHLVDGTTKTGAVFCEQYAITSDGARRFSRYTPELYRVTR